jgi:hypothetical protein
MWQVLSRTGKRASANVKGFGVPRMLNNKIHRVIDRSLLDSTGEPVGNVPVSSNAEGTFKNDAQTAFKG